MPVEPFELEPAHREHLARLGLEFQADFFRAQLARRPDHLEALIDLGHVLTQLGRYAEGLAVDRRLARLLPEEPTVHYNLACSLALTGRTDEAFEALERAVELGYDDLDFLARDDDLATLRDDPRFRRLIDGTGAR